jgi:hypothetical protein
MKMKEKEPFKILIPLFLLNLDQQIIQLPMETIITPLLQIFKDNKKLQNLIDSGQFNIQLIAQFSCKNPTQLTLTHMELESKPFLVIFNNNRIPMRLKDKVLLQTLEKRLLKDLTLTTVILTEQD